MAKLSREEREKIAERRILRVLQAATVANSRTLEQKISDAGPFPQRIDPHILTPVRARMERAGSLVRVIRDKSHWFHRADAPTALIEERIAPLLLVHKHLSDRDLTLRIGQTLEIATYRGLRGIDGLWFFGRFTDLAAHDDSTLYKKEEPPQHVGSDALQTEQNLDFLVMHREAGALGLECKNAREWLYPDRREIKDLLGKCLQMNAVPVLIARRIPFVTFRLLTTCGVILHQNFNQLMPTSAEGIVERAKRKDLLGYHDLRLGNMPDARLTKFLGTNMMAVAPGARDKFDHYKDLISAFAKGEAPYHEFAAQVRRREKGQHEDHDWPGPETDPADWDDMTE